MYICTLTNICLLDFKVFKISSSNACVVKEIFWSVSPLNPIYGMCLWHTCHMCVALVMLCNDLQTMYFLKCFITKSVCPPLKRR